MWYKRFWNVDSLVLKMFCALNTKKLFSKKLIRTVTENIQIIEGFANPQETRKFCDLFCKERPTSLVKKYDSSFSSFFSFFNKVNYCNLDKHWQQALWLMEQVMSVSMKIIGVVCYRRLWIPAVMLFRYLKTNERITRNRWISRSRCWKRVLMGMLISSRMLIFFRAFSRYEAVGNILNGIVYSTNIKRESLIFQGRVWNIYSMMTVQIFTHDSQGNPYTPVQLQKQIDMLLRYYNITTLDCVCCK